MDVNPETEVQDKEVSLIITDKYETTQAGSPQMCATVQSTYKPDITIQCRRCREFIDIRTLADHRAYHNALHLMKYERDDATPETNHLLMVRRNALIKHLKGKSDSENPVDINLLSKINNAYEILKADMEKTYETHRQVKVGVNPEVDGISLNCSPQCVSAIGICSNHNEHWKSYMEDTRVYQDYFGNDVKKCYLGIFDGHHGHFAADIAAVELHRLLLHEMMKFDPETKTKHSMNMADCEVSKYHFDHPEFNEADGGFEHQESAYIIRKILQFCEEKYQDSEISEKEQKSAKSSDKNMPRQSFARKPFCVKMSRAFKRAYNILDILLSYGKDEYSQLRWSGCSALSILIQDKFEADTDLWHEENSGLSTNDQPLKSPSYSDEDDAWKPELENFGAIHLANAGNVKAVLIRGNRAYTLTKDHTPNNYKEKERVIRAGGDISISETNMRVNGLITATRGLGNHGDKRLKRCILVDPYTTSVPIDQYAQMLVLASNGLWEVFSADEVASLLLHLLPQNNVMASSRVSTSIRRLISCGKSHSRMSKLDKRFLSASTASSAGQLHQSMARSHITQHAETGDTVDNIPYEEEESHVAHRNNQGDYFSDMKTEAGSQMGDERVDEEESGNDGDIESYSETSDMRRSPLFPDAGYTKEEKQRDIAKAMAEYLVQAALLGGAKDNTTVMVLLLPGSGIE